MSVSGKRPRGEKKTEKMIVDKLKRQLHVAKKPAMRTGKAALVRTGGNFAQVGASSGHEKKFIDVSSSVSMSNTGNFALLNGCAPGSDAINRIGRRIKVKSVLLRCRINLGATPTTCSFRYMIVVDLQANANNPNVVDLLVVQDVNSPNNLGNRARFITWLDWVGVVDTAGPTIVTKVLFLRKDLVTTFNNGTAGTVADIQTGSLLQLTLSDNSTAAQQPVFTGRIRTRFEDD